ncbi:MAG: NAD(P)/FAD-dependent oxidoreductase, partial [Gallionellaceae bacterium]
MSDEGPEILIVGAGPAGLTAATYLARFRRRVLVADGGAPRACWIPLSHNMPGFPSGITGDAILQRMTEQATEYGAVIESGRVESLSRNGDGFIARLNGRDIPVRAV